MHKVFIGPGPGMSLCWSSGYCSNTELQETKWFVSGIYSVPERIVVVAGNLQNMFDAMEVDLISQKCQR